MLTCVIFTASISTLLKCVKHMKFMKIIFVSLGILHHSLSTEPNTDATLDQRNTCEIHVIINFMRKWDIRKYYV